MRLERSENTRRNVVAGEIDRVTGILLPFIVRTLIIRVIGAEYLGLTGLFYSILQTLSLAEMGFGTALVFCMYRPIADNDQDTLCALMDAYRRIYFRIGLVVLSAGLMLLPFLPRLIRGPVPEDIRTGALYLIYLVNTCLVFFLFPERKALLTAYQRDDLGISIHIFTQMLMYAGQAAAVLLTKNYYLYALMMPLTTVLYSLLCAARARKQWPGLFEGRTVSRRQFPGIRTQVAGLVIRKAAIMSRNAMDAMFISAFLGLTLTAVYSNYYYIMDAVVMMLAVVKTAMAGGVGNSIALESREKNLLDMGRINFLFMLLGGWCAICILCLIQPFMRLWLGGEMMLPDGTAMLFAVYFYVLKMSDIRSLYAESAGVWWEMRYVSVAETAANLILNLVLVQVMGLAGILAATLISYFLFNFAGGALVLFRVCFTDGGLGRYFAEHFLYAAVTAAAGAVTMAVSAAVPGEGAAGFLMKGAVCAVIPPLLYYGIYSRTQIFKDCQQLLLPLLRRRKGRSE